jgi:hypothetical protein
MGMTVSAAAAAVSSFSGLRSLALATGWGEWLSPLLPLTIDAYAMTATRVWLANVDRSGRTRRFARWNATASAPSTPSTPPSPATPGSPPSQRHDIQSSTREWTRLRYLGFLDDEGRDIRTYFRRSDYALAGC